MIQAIVNIALIVVDIIYMWVLISTYNNYDMSTYEFCFGTFVLIFFNFTHNWRTIEDELKKED